MTAPHRHRWAEPAGELHKLATLVEVSEALAGTLDLPAELERALGVVVRRCSGVRAAVTLLEDASGELEVRAAVGLSAQGRQARYRVGEGITGRVAAQGHPIIVPRISREPLFMHRAATRAERSRELSFVCVPLLLEGRCIGTLSVDLPQRPSRDLDRAATFLQVVGSLIAQAVRIQRLIQDDRRRLVEENSQLREELRDRFDFVNLVGNSGPMQAVFRQMAQVAGTNATVLLRGESGTGKELIAQALHHHSPRSSGPFVRVNCAALPDTLIEAELFGHERGAFTGAIGRRKGRFELADGGTIFLDEIGELRPSTQVKLLRVLQERELERVGGTDTLRVDVRFIAATNRDLEAALADGSYREDLYYRLNVFAIHVPPLRERRSDLPSLADHLVRKHAAQHGKSIKRISTPAIDMLVGYHWPGNVRELENAIVHAIVVAEGEVIHAHHLPPTLQTAAASGTLPRGSLASAVARLERALIEDALKATQGNRARAARLLGATDRVLNYKIRKLAVNVGRYRRHS